MNYHNISKVDMLNGEDLGAVLWLSGCAHNCPDCQNPITHDCNDGLPFDEKAKKELFDELEKSYISRITFSGGDPLHSNNIEGVYSLIQEIRTEFPDIAIWLYSGFRYKDILDMCSVLNGNEEFLLRRKIVEATDVFVDGRFVRELADVNYPWAGSVNQKVIDMVTTMQIGFVTDKNQTYREKWYSDMISSGNPEDKKKAELLLRYLY